MGLSERRAAKNFETNQLPTFKTQIDEAAGFNVPLDVKWDTIATDGYAERYEEFFPQAYFKPLVNALKAIAVDDMGREALQGALKKVVIQNTKDSGYAGGMASFVDGVLTLDHSPSSNLHQEEDRAKAIQQTLEKAL